MVTIFGKTWDLHVRVALGISPQQNLDLIRGSVAFLKSQGREVIYDAEHFFDGYKGDAEYALATLQAAHEAGADTIVLCDTNGGTLTSEIRERFEDASKHVDAPLGIHTHNDCEMAVANAIAAVQQGAVQVSGDHQRLWGTLRQRQPLLGDSQSRVEAGNALDWPRKPEAPDGSFPLRQRTGQLDRNARTCPTSARAPLPTKGAFTSAP